MNVTIVPFKAEHYEMMTHRRERPDEAEAFGGIEKFAKRYEEGGPGYTMFAPDGRCIGAGGVFLAWPGVGEAWSLMTEHIQDFPKSVFQVWRDLLEVIMQKNRLHRVQSTCRAEDLRARVWLEHLGFEFEGILKKYGADQADHAVFGRVR